MAQEQGLVANIGEDGWAQVVTDRRDACDDCGASHCCASFVSSSKMVIKALNRAGAGVGDLVTITLGSGTVIQSAAIFYMIPILGLIFGAAVGTTSNLGLPLSETAAAILLSFVGLALGFLITAVIIRWLSVSHPIWQKPITISASSQRSGESLMTPPDTTPQRCGSILDSAKEKIWPEISNEVSKIDSIKKAT